MDKTTSDRDAAGRFEISRMAERGTATYAPTALRLVRACDLYRDLHARIGLMAEGWDGEHPIVRAHADLREELDIVYQPAEIDVELTELTMTSSEIVHHVRSSLDYCAYQTVFRDNGSPKSGTQFPLVDDKKSFERVLKNSMPGITQEHRSWIESVQPYNGVSWTCLLKELSNRDKHRFPIDIVDVYTFAIDRTKVFDDPLGDANYVGYQVESAAIEFRVSDPNDGGGRSNEVTGVLADLMFGAVDLANRFLLDAGEAPIEVTRSDAAT